MKKNIVYTSIITLFFFTLCLFFACKKNSTTTDTAYGVDVKSNPSMVNKAMRLYGKLTDGKMPFSSGTSSGGLLIVQNPKAVEVAAGVDVYIPFKTSNDSNIAKMYVQIEGADSYWELPPRPAGIASGPLHMKIFIPNFVNKGDFNLIFSVQDNQGKISSTATTNTIITGILPCNASATGSIGVTVKAIDLGERYGLIRVRYNTYTITDRIDIKHNNIWKASTGNIAFMGSSYFPSCDNYNSGTGEGFVGEEGILILERKPGEDKNLYIYVTGCESSTRWDISLECPEENWYANLPPCPCEYETAKSKGSTTNPNGIWIDGGYKTTSLVTYHYGASYEVRWQPSKGGDAGQQCTYDEQKHLITRGLAAGTPDKVSPQGIYTAFHYIDDVMPWSKLDYDQYLAQWPPNTGGCTGGSENISPINHMKSMINGLTANEVMEILIQADKDLNDATLKSYIKGVTINPPTDLKTRLQDWRTHFTSVLSPTICSALDKAINNL